MQELNALWWLVVILPPLLFIQRQVHREMQTIFYLITGRLDISIWLFSLIFFPGVFLHECSHYLMARILGVRTAGFSILPQVKSDGHIQMGFVETARSDMIRQALIGLAPLLSGCAVVAYIGIWRLGVTGLWLPLINLDGAAALDQLGLIYARPDFWLWFYLLFAVGSTMFPSRSDQRAWLPLAILVTLALGLAILAGAGGWMAAHMMPAVTTLFSGLASILAIILLVHLVIFIPLAFIRYFIAGLLRRA